MKDLFDLTSHIYEDTLPELRTAMESKLQSTRTTIATLLQSGGQSAATADAFARWQKVQTEVRPSAPDIAYALLTILRQLGLVVAVAFSPVATESLASKTARVGASRGDAAFAAYRRPDTYR